VYVYNTNTGKYEFKDKFYTGDKLTVDFNVKEGEILVLVGNPKQDYG